MNNENKERLNPLGFINFSSIMNSISKECFKNADKKYVDACEGSLVPLKERIKNLDDDLKIDNQNDEVIKKREFYCRMIDDVSKMQDIIQKNKEEMSNEDVDDLYETFVNTVKHYEERYKDAIKTKIY